MLPKLWVDKIHTKGLVTESWCELLHLGKTQDVSGNRFYFDEKLYYYLDVCLLTFLIPQRTENMKMQKYLDKCGI